MSGEQKEDLRALVLGATGGIGSVIVEQLLGLGHHVVACGRSRDKLDRLKAPTGVPRLTRVLADMDQADAPQAIVAAAGTVDVLVSAAGVVHPEPFLDADPDHWAAMFATNVLAPMRVIQAVARTMAARRTGTIVFIGSGQARAVAANTVAYAATKHAMAAFATGLRLELGPVGIRIIDVSPGYTGATEFHRHATHLALQGAFSERSYLPIDPSCVASAVTFAIGLPPAVEVPHFELRPVGQHYLG